MAGKGPFSPGHQEVQDKKVSLPLLLARGAEGGEAGEGDTDGGREGKRGIDHVPPDGQIAFFAVISRLVAAEKWPRDLA